jgi:hypothetical protein
MELEEQFDIACREAIAACRQLARPYIPTAWIGMINDLGAVEAARQLVISADIQPGFTRLIEEGRADLTVEWAVLNDRWEMLFDDDVKEAARWRLLRAGVELS